MRVSTLHRPSQRRRLVVATLFALAVAAFFALAAPTPASAHAVLISSSPEEGETLTEVPTQVSLTFNENLIDIGGEISVVDASQTDWVDGGFTIDGPTASAPLKAGMPDGNYELRWQVVSADGHPISGITPFSVDAGAGAANDAAEAGEHAASGSSPAPDASTEAPAEVADESAESSTADADANANNADNDASANNTESTETIGFFGGIPQPWRAILIGVIGAAFALGVVALVRTMRRNSSANRPNGETPTNDGSGANAATNDTTGDDTTGNDADARRDS